MTSRVANPIQGECDCCGEFGNVLQLVATSSPERALRLCVECIDFVKAVADHAKGGA